MPGGHWSASSLLLLQPDRFCQGVNEVPDHQAKAGICRKFGWWATAQLDIWPLVGYSPTSCINVAAMVEIWEDNGMWFIVCNVSCWGRGELPTSIGEDLSGGDKKKTCRPLSTDWYCLRASKRLNNAVGWLVAGLSSWSRGALRNWASAGHGMLLGTLRKFSIARDFDHTAWEVSIQRIYIWSETTCSNGHLGNRTMLRKGWQQLRCSPQCQATEDTHLRQTICVQL